MPTVPAPSPRIIRNKRRHGRPPARAKAFPSGHNPYSQSLPLRGRWLEEPDEVAYNFLRIHERASRGGHWPPAFYVNFQRKWGCLKKTKCPNRRTVIANQSADWCGNPLPKPSPPGKVARASPASARRMRALPLPYGRGAPDGAERACVYPLSHFVTAPPEWEPREKRIATPV